MPKIRQSVNKINYTQGLVLDRVFAPAVVESAPAPTNIITNGSLTVNSNGWYSINGYRDTSVFRSSPASFGTYATEEDVADAEYTQSGALTVGSSYSLAFWVRTGTQAFQVTLQLGTASYSTSTTLSSSSSWQYVKFENKLCVGNTNLRFYVYGANGIAYNLDDVSLVLGPTALP